MLTISIYWIVFAYKTLLDCLSSTSGQWMASHQDTPSKPHTAPNPISNYVKEVSDFSLIVVQSFMLIMWDEEVANLPALTVGLLPGS